MKKPKSKGWVEDIPEYDPDQEELELEIPQILLGLGHTLEYLLRILLILVFSY